MVHSKDDGWIDPYPDAKSRVPSPSADRRQYPRAAAGHRLHIAVHRGSGAKPLVAQGEVLDLSLNGMYLKTRQSLREGQLVDLAIPTKGCPEDFALPKAFLGKARVARVDPDTGDICKAALEVGYDLLDDMAYAVFVEYQHRNGLLKS